jgi:hypothetical protein
MFAHVWDRREAQIEREIGLSVSGIGRFDFVRINSSQGVPSDFDEMSLLRSSDVWTKKMCEP